MPLPTIRPQTALYGFQPTPTLLAGLLGTPYRPPTTVPIGAGVARPLLYGFDPMVTLLATLGQPLYAAADLTAAPRFRLVASGSATLGGETLTALVVGPVKVLEVAPTTADNRVPIQYDARPLFLGTTEHLRNAPPVVVATSTAGTQTTVTTTVVQGLSVVDNIVYLELGGMLAGTTYSVRLDTVSDHGVGRAIVFPAISCRAA